MSWLGNSPSTVIRVEYRYIATASQTVFSGVDSRGATLSIDPNNYDIYRNGVRLDKTLNVSSATASAITLGSGVTANDIILIYAYGYVSQLGTYKGPDGTAAAPAYTFGLDTDTGLYRVGANALGFTAGGTKKLEVKSTGVIANTGLTVTGLLDLSGSAAGQIAFPGTQNASANVNTLDDYEEGTWTPNFTFATPGNLSKTFSTQSGWYIKIGQLVIASFDMGTSAFTWTTASGALSITGLPFTCNGQIAWGPVALSGWTMASYTWSQAFIQGGTTAGVVSMGSGVGIAQPTSTNFPSGGTVYIRGKLVYIT